MEEREDKKKIGSFLPLLVFPFFFLFLFIEIPGFVVLGFGVNGRMMM